MAEVVPLLRALRALNAMIIQYRNRVVRVNKSGPQLMTRLRVLFQILNDYLHNFKTPSFKRMGEKTGSNLHCFKIKEEGC